MSRRPALAVLLVCALASPCLSQLSPAPAAIGFGVGVPYAVPVAWASSFSYVSLEALLSSHLTLYADLGTYPASFPDLHEGSVALIAKGWIGHTALIAGGGMTMQYRRVGSAWAMLPMLNLRAGYQIWLLDSFALFLQLRTLEAFPVTWSLSPEIAVGLTVGLGRARPETPRVDGQMLWFLAGLGVAALVAFLPRQ